MRGIFSTCSQTESKYDRRNERIGTMLVEEIGHPWGEKLLRNCFRQGKFQFFAFLHFLEAKIFLKLFSEMNLEKNLEAFFRNETKYRYGVYQFSTAMKAQPILRRLRQRIARKLGTSSNGV